MATSNFAGARASLEAVDLTSENARIADINAEQARIEAAIERAQERSREITAILADRREPMGQAVADALLADRAARDAATQVDTDEALKAERTALDLGMRELRSRFSSFEEDKREITIRARGKLSGAAGPWLAELTAEAQRAAEQLVASYVSIATVADATGSQLPQGLQRAVEGVMGELRMLPWRRQVAVPQEILEALEPLRRKGLAAPSRIRSVVQMP